MWAYIFGAICPKKGKGAGLVLPYCDTSAMNQHLAEISAAVDPGAHASLILDRAGWHTTLKPVVPQNISLLFLPPYSPELNPVENIWQFMRDCRLHRHIVGSWAKEMKLEIILTAKYMDLAEERQVKVPAAKILL